MAKTPTNSNAFEHDGQNYEFVIPALIWKKKDYTAEEIAADEKMRAEVVEHCWHNNRDEQREEEDFNENGILKLVYITK